MYLQHGQQLLMLAEIACSIFVIVLAPMQPVQLLVMMQMMGHWLIRKKQCPQQWLG
jgi:hypothetical protein